MTVRQPTLTMLLAAALSIPAAAQTALSIKDTHVTIAGCLTRVSALSHDAPQLLVWSRDDLVLTDAAAVGQESLIGRRSLTSRVLFWLEDEQDLATYLGRRIEITGDLEDIEEAELEIDREGDFTEIEFTLAGKKTKARVPTAWLGAAGRHDAEFDVVVRKVDVDAVRVLGPCSR
jgi:hypothetical protein